MALGREVGVWSARPGPKDCQPLRMLGRALGQSPLRLPAGTSAADPLIKDLGLLSKLVATSLFPFVVIVLEN